MHFLNSHQHNVLSYLFDKKTGVTLLHLIDNLSEPRFPRASVVTSVYVLEEQGLVRSQMEPITDIEDTFPRQLYSVTDEGRKAFEEY